MLVHSSFDECILATSMRGYDKQCITKRKMKAAFVMYSAIRDKHSLSRGILHFSLVSDITSDTNIVR